jgi:hypothetical protein
MEWTDIHLVTDCLQAAGMRGELGPVDVLKCCQGRWSVYFAQNSPTLPSPCFAKSSGVQLNMQQLSESDSIPVEWARCDSVCQYPRLDGQGNDSVVY